jgi:hypothetical protein
MTILPSTEVPEHFQSMRGGPVKRIRPSQVAAGGEHNWGRTVRALMHTASESAEEGRRIVVRGHLVVLPSGGYTRCRLCTLLINRVDLEVRKG